MAYSDPFVLDKAMKELKSCGGDTQKDILYGFKKKVNDARRAIDTRYRFVVSLNKSMASCAKHRLKSNDEEGR